MGNEYLKEIRRIAEESFGVSDLSIKSRRRIFINARCWYYKACRGVKEVHISHEAAARFLDQDHASSIHAIKEYDLNLKMDGFRDYYEEANKKLEVYKGRNKPYDPIEWRDRKISRIIKLYRAKPSKDEILTNVLERLNIGFKEGRTSRAEIRQIIEES